MVKIMNIEVTKHSIRRYRERLFDHSSSDEFIINMLKTIAQMGKVVMARPGYSDSCMEIKYKGISIVAIDQEDYRVVVTCLGEPVYRKWVKNRDIPLKLSGRTLYDNVLITHGT
ncbi:MAG TPA: hypothetical protein VN426_14835 [Syntrophomonadaceae bacterium]|nr:hypothetical protein [Syntrophomonadaceae bacterium]